MNVCLFVVLFVVLSPRMHRAVSRLLSTEEGEA